MVQGRAGRLIDHTLDGIGRVAEDDKIEIIFTVYTYDYTSWQATVERGNSGASLICFGAFDSGQLTSVSLQQTTWTTVEVNSLIPYSLYAVAASMLKN